MRKKMSVEDKVIALSGMMAIIMVVLIGLMELQGE